MRQVFLNDLPRWGKGGKAKEGTIIWEASIGYRIKFIYDDIEGWIEIIDYNKSSKSLTITYGDQEFNIIYGNFIKCKLGKLLNKYTNEFKYKINTIFKDSKRDIIITDREYRTVIRKNGSKENKKWYKYTCNKCGWTEGWIEENNLKRGDNCSCCVGKIVIEGINDIPTTTPWLIPYFQGGYDEAKLYTKMGTGNSNNVGGYIYPICPDCGRVKNKKISIANIYRYETIGCSCNDSVSYPNKFMTELLNQLKLEYINEYSPAWINPKRYDFYIPSLNIIIEMDGQFHKNNNEMNGITVEENIKLDNYKDDIAIKNGIQNIIRVDCNYPHMEKRYEYIKKSILNNKILNELFNINNIDWLICHEFALSNLVKVACNLWNSGIHNISEIASKMNVEVTTARSYLKSGAKISWCDYNSKHNEKPVLIVEYNKVFNSINELERKSVEIFGIKLNSRNIGRVCLGHRKTYKGLHFEYVENTFMMEEGK